MQLNTHSKQLVLMLLLLLLLPALTHLPRGSAMDFVCFFADCLLACLLLLVSHNYIRPQLEAEILQQLHVAVAELS